MLDHPDPHVLESSAKLAPSHQAALETCPYHFLSVFKKITGITPHQYLVYLRLKHATKLLNETSWSVTRIASEVAFADLSTFSYADTKGVGHSPSLVRSVSQRLDASAQSWLPIEMVS